MLCVFVWRGREGGRLIRWSLWCTRGVVRCRAERACASSLQCALCVYRCMCAHMQRSVGFSGGLAMQGPPKPRPGIPCLAQSCPFVVLSFRCLGLPNFVSLAVSIMSAERPVPANGRLQSAVMSAGWARTAALAGGRGSLLPSGAGWRHVLSPTPTAASLEWSGFGCRKSGVAMDHVRCAHRVCGMWRWWWA